MEERQVKAANELEELAMALKDVVREMRKESTDLEYAYALVYQTRHRMGYIIRDMARVGVPRKHLFDKANDIIDLA